MALDGLSEELLKEFPMRVSSRKSPHKVHFIRYCDDFIITGRTKEKLESEVMPLVEKFLCKRGLFLSKKKTKITCITEGFDFLGQNIRKYKDDKLIIKPSAKSYKKVLKKIRGELKKYKTATQQAVIRRLNPIIRGWTNYHRHVCSKSTFSKLNVSFR